jgi:dTDP-4-dehydrorhamnose 3,5-epimerase
VLSFAPTKLNGVVQFQRHPPADSRGSFARLYCPQAFAEAGIDFNAVQMSLSANHSAHTLRGMHYQQPPFSEAKVVQVVVGAIYDVVADMRPDSATFMRWQGFELSRNNGKGLYIPEGCAHGFLTLADATDVLYVMGRMYEPGRAAGFRYDDPAFSITWPAQPQIIAQADQDWGPFSSGS